MELVLGRSRPRRSQASCFSPPILSFFGSVSLNYSVSALGGFESGEPRCHHLTSSVTVWGVGGVLVSSLLHGGILLPGPHKKIFFLHTQEGDAQKQMFMPECVYGRPLWCLRPSADKQGKKRCVIKIPVNATGPVFSEVKKVEVG